jgi:D-xylose transport system substrate-binding protein
MGGGKMNKRGQKAKKLKAAFLFLLLLPWGCARGQDQSPKNKETVTIGLVMDSLVEERWTRDRNIFTSTARRRNAEVIVQIGEESAANQEAQINYLMERGVDALVLIASDPHYLSKTVLDLRRRGVPILLYERMVYNGGANLLMAFDGEMVGTLQAQEILKKIPRGSILIYNGLSGDFYAEGVHRGILNTLQDAIERGNIKIASDHWPSTTRAEEAFEFINSYLDYNAPVDGIIALNDLQAEAIINALAVKRLTGKVAVIGADADLAACQRIVGGTQTMTVYKPINYIATAAADLAIDLAQDYRFTIHHAINDGTFRIPYFQFFPVAVTAENMEETVIRDGFHLLDDVYRNTLPE